MMKEELITFETAKLAKKKGFDLIADNPPITKDRISHGINLTGHKMPTQSLLQKWLREKHFIFVEPRMISTVGGGTHTVVVLKKLLKYTNDHVGKYEEVLEKGLQEALELIEH